MENNLGDLRKKLIKGKVDETLDSLASVVKEELKDKKILQELSVLRYRWETLQKEERQNIISHEKASITKNQITSSILGLIDKVERIIEHGPTPAIAKSKKWIGYLATILILGIGGTYIYLNYFKDTSSELSSVEFIDCPFQDSDPYNILIVPFTNYSSGDNSRGVEKAIRNGLIVQAEKNDIENVIKINKQEISLDANTAKDQLTSCLADLLIWGSFEEGDSIDISIKYITADLVSEFLGNESIMIADGTVRSLLSLERGEIISQMEGIFEITNHLITGINLIKENQLDKAIVELDNIKGKNSKVKNLIEKTKGDINILKGDYDNAIKNYSRSIKFGDSNEKAKAYNNIGYALLKKGDVISARENFEKANQLDGGNKDILENFEIVDKEFQSMTQTIITTTKTIQPAAESPIEKPVAKKPVSTLCENFAACFNKGMQNRNSKNFDEALNYFEAAKLYNSKVQDSYNGIGLIHLDKGDYDQAINFFQKAILVEPDFPNAYYYLSTGYSAKRDSKNSKKYYDEFLRRTNGSGNLRNNRIVDDLN